VIYICIPSYNEARTVGVLLWKIRQVMAGFQRDYQLLVVDDASTDDTAAVLEPYTRVLPLTVFRNDERRGYAASLELLLREAVRRATYPRRDVIVTLQADFTDEPEEIPAFVKRIEGGADVVTGTTVGEARGPRAARWMRRALAFMLRRSEWPGPLTDPLSGFRAFRVACVKKAIESRNGGPLLQWDGWAANAELLQLMRPYCRRIEEAPVMPRPDRRLRPTRFDTWATARALVRFLRSRPATNGGPQPSQAPPPRARQIAPAPEAAGGSAEATTAAQPARPPRRRPPRRRGGAGRRPTAARAGQEGREGAVAEAAAAVAPEAAAEQGGEQQPQASAQSRRRSGSRRRGRPRGGRRPQPEAATGGTTAVEKQTPDDKGGPQ